MALQQYRPLTSVGRGFGVEGTKPLGHLKLAAGLDLNYASQPLQVKSMLAGTSSTTDAVRSATGSDLMMAIGLFNRFELAVALPVTLSQSGDTPAGAPQPASAGVGDVRITARARIWEQGVNGWSLAGSLTGSSALGQSATYINSPGFGVEPRLVVANKHRSLQWGGRMGLRLNDGAFLLGTRIGNSLTVGAGVDKRAGRAFHAIAEIAGATPLGDGGFSRRLTPLEATLGARYQWKKFSFGLGTGFGIVAGVGSPAWRTLATFSWSNDPPDSDRDGVVDTADGCPDDAEDKDGFEDSDGCPDPDNDKDGILDGMDQCPSDPEDLDGFEDEDGCPDLDNDKDGIADVSDKCPNEPETVNEFEDEDGCPDEAPPTDKDGDGILDRDDKCPDDPEDKDGFEDEDGCPDPDNDKDGILDVDDKCPLEPETINGRQDEDGCPDEGAPQVVIGEKELETLQPVFFTLDRFRVRHRFWNILDQIALTLKAHPEIGRCAVEGHADATGPADWNKRLSVMRAETVVAYLTSKGVDAKRLSAIGQGDAKPWADNETAEGRARNRRVMFHIEGVFSSRLPPSSKKVFDDAQTNPEPAKTPSVGPKTETETETDKQVPAKSETKKTAPPQPEGKSNSTPKHATGTDRFPVWMGPTKPKSVDTANARTPASIAPVPPPAEIPQIAKTLRDAVRLPPAKPVVKRGVGE